MAHCKSGSVDVGGEAHLLAAQAAHRHDGKAPPAISPCARAIRQRRGNNAQAWFRVYRKGRCWLRRRRGRAATTDADLEAPLFANAAAIEPILKVPPPNKLARLAASASWLATARLCWSTPRRARPTPCQTVSQRRPAKMSTPQRQQSGWRETAKIAASGGAAIGIGRSAATPHPMRCRPEDAQHSGTFGQDLTGWLRVAAYVLRYAPSGDAGRSARRANVASVSGSSSAPVNTRLPGPARLGASSNNPA